LKETHTLQNIEEHPDECSSGQITSLQELHRWSQHLAISLGEQAEASCEMA
jgi:hypothetical protein